MKKSGSYHGSPKESHTFGGCDSDNQMAARGPGKAAMKITPKPVGRNFQGGDMTSKSSPKGMKTYKEE